MSPQTSVGVTLMIVQVSYEVSGFFLFVFCFSCGFFFLGTSLQGRFMKICIYL